MTRSIDVLLNQLHFPMTCVVCMSPATQHYKLQKIFTFGRRSVTVTADVPMCERHHQAAGFKGTAERLIGILGIIFGAFAGLFTTGALLVYWHNTGENNILLNLVAGGVTGLGAFLILWAIITLTIAPLFADRESKEARNAVRITRFWPREQVVRLMFENDQLAEIVQKNQ